METKHTPKLTLLNFIGFWFKSCDSETRQQIAWHYTDETGDNTDITKGLTNQSERWLEENYPNDITDYVCRIGQETAAERDRLKVLIENQSDDIANLNEYIQKVESINSELLEALNAIVRQHDPSVGGLILPPSEGEMQMMKEAIKKASE